MCSLTLRTKAIDYFCLAADANEDLPPLKNKEWVDYRLTALEWKQVKLVHHCLQVRRCHVISIFPSDNSVYEACCQTAQ